MRLTVLLTVAVLAAFSSAGGSDPVPPSAAAQTTTTVQVGDFFFCDASLPAEACETQISAGDTITWEYSSGTVGHTVTDCGESCNSPTDTPLFDSGDLAPNDTFSFTFDSPGTYFYYCEFHPIAMRARVVVRGQPTATPSPTPEAAATPTATPEPPPQPAQEPSHVPSATPAPEEGDGGLSGAVIVGVVIGAMAGALALGSGAVYLLRRRT